MTREELNKNLIAVIETLHEVDYAPESSLYLGLGSNMDTWQLVKSVLLAGKLATFDNYQVRITEAGNNLYKKIAAFKGIA